MAILKKMLKALASIFLVLIVQPAYCKTRKIQQPIDEQSYSKLTYDLGFSFGSYNNASYTEANLGLNYFFKSWLAWRNAVFGRFATTNIYGLDSSMRAILNAPTITAFLGPGYRIATTSQSGPFAEGGAIFHLGGFSLGGGVKVIMYTNPGSLPNSDLEYFIVLAGGGVL